MTQKARELAPTEPTFDRQQDDDIPDRPMTALEAASFIESMTAELRAMARATKLDALDYFLEMARLEASAEVVRLARANGRLGKSEPNGQA